MPFHSLSRKEVGYNADFLAKEFCLEIHEMGQWQLIVYVKDWRVGVSRWRGRRGPRGREGSFLVAAGGAVRKHSQSLVKRQLSYTEANN